jgi:selenide, water dikinase
MGPGDLAHVLRLLQPHTHPALLVGLHTSDDAAVYQLDAETALVQTLDFFPPIVDDAYQFGAIAAANALSDIYAMGARPLLALNIVAWPEDLDREQLAALLQGGMDKVAEAGAVVAGGHTVTDREPKYGLAVTGLVHPQRLLTKGGAQPHDVLVLTKPLGTGVITTAARADRARPEHLAAAVASMTALNRRASEAMVAAGVRAATDITGFGLLGHAYEMADASGMRFLIEADEVPLLDGAWDYAAAGLTTGGGGRNAHYLLEPDAAAGVTAPRVTVARPLPDPLLGLLLDPQTSGGLLGAIPPRHYGDLSARLGDAGILVYRIGEVAEGRGLVVT